MKTSTLFLAGDVMTGRGIDQVLLHPGDPALHETYVKDARGYIELAERAGGPVPRPVACSSIWGDALQQLGRESPDARIVNLETSITTSTDYWQGKEVHYRMNPKNIECLTAAGIHVCSLANNHVLDWGYYGLRETLKTLKKAGIKSAGAGMNLLEAEAPAIVEMIQGKGRVLVFASGSVTGGVRPGWAATENRAGVNFLADFSEETILGIMQRINAVKQAGDIVVFSLHWGLNWGYEISRQERQFAHRLIESGADIIHGHSSHHVKGIELYHDRLILYGCGDLLNDYEGIPGYEDYRGDLGLMYLPAVNPSTGRLVELRMMPTRIRNLRVNRASAEEAAVLADILNREGRKLGTTIELSDTILTLVPYKSQKRS